MIREPICRLRKLRGLSKQPVRKIEKDMYQTMAKLAKVARARLRPRIQRRKKKRRKGRLSGTGHIPRPG